MVDTGEFYRHLARHYQNQRQQVEDQNRVLWDTTIGLINQIATAASDGSSIHRLKEYGEREARRLQDLLDPKSMMDRIREEMSDGTA